MAYKNKIYKKSSYILNKKIVTVRTIQPGMIVEFNYAGEKVFDKKPLVLVFANGLFDKKVNSGSEPQIHAINLNYLKQIHISRLKRSLEAAPTLGSPIKFVDITTDDKGRPVPMNESYTRLSIPTLGDELKSGAPLGQAQTRVVMQSIYSAKVKPILDQVDAYRIYNTKDITSPKACRFKFTY